MRVSALVRCHYSIECLDAFSVFGPESIRSQLPFLIMIVVVFCLFITCITSKVYTVIGDRSRVSPLSRPSSPRHTATVSGTRSLACLSLGSSGGKGQQTLYCAKPCSRVYASATSMRDAMLTG